jgi:hypothetical protein
MLFKINRKQMFIEILWLGNECISLCVVLILGELSLNKIKIYNWRVWTNFVDLARASEMVRQLVG